MYLKGWLADNLAVTGTARNQLTITQKLQGTGAQG
jgi:hypothetical protein